MSLYKGQKSTQEPRKEKSRHSPCWRSSGYRAAWTETRGCYPRSTTLNLPTFSFREEMKNSGWKKIKTLEDLGGTAKQEPKTDSFRHADSISERNWTESRFDSGSGSFSDFDSTRLESSRNPWDTKWLTSLELSNSCLELENVHKTVRPNLRHVRLCAFEP